MSDLRGDIVGQDKSVAGQNDFGWWVGEEDMGFGICLCATPRKRTPEAVEQIQFRLMANRAFGMFGAFAPTPDGQAAALRLNRIYMQALPDMQCRRLLPNRAGVCWTNGDTRVIWTFQELPLTLSAGTTLTRLNGQTEPGDRPKRPGGAAGLGRIPSPRRGGARLALNLNLSLLNLLS